MNSPFPKTSSTPGQGLVVVKLRPDGSSGLEKITCQYPLKLVSPPNRSDAASVLVFLLSYGGGLVSGDTVQLSIQIEPEARLSIVTQGYTKIFKAATPDIRTRQTLQVSVGRQAGLCLLPEPVQPFEGSVYEQRQIVELAADASLCLLDWLTQGRAARGENWSLLRWSGRNEIWSAGDDRLGRQNRLLVRDTVILDGNQSNVQTQTLGDTMHGMGVFGTLLLRGPLTRALGEFFLAEFAALPRLGAPDWRFDGQSQGNSSERHMKTSPSNSAWRSERVEMEKKGRVLWSAAKVRGCVVVKFGAAAVEGGRLWIGSMLAQDGSILRHFGEDALMCVR